MPHNENGQPIDPHSGQIARVDDEGGLRAPPHLHGWRKAWWWFDFIVLVNLARLRFIVILAVIGVVIMKWDTLAAYYDKWMRADSSTQADSADYEYFCPMHPTVVRDNDKEKCPICFMPLSRRKKGAAQSAEPLPAGTVNRVQLSPYRMVLAGVQTWPVDYVPLAKDLHTVGYIEFNERGQKTVAARVAGRIDKLYANVTGEMVQAGQDLALLYSPDLLVTMQNLVDAKRRGTPELIESARVRLQLLGVDDAQIEATLKSGKADTLVHVRSPLSGHIIKKYVQEGQYVQEGSPLYDVADLSTVWIDAQVYEDDLSLLPTGYGHGAIAPDDPGLEVTATTRSDPSEEFHGKLSFIYPHVDQDSRTVTVRFELENLGHKLRPGGTADVAINIRPADVPSLAHAAIDEQQKEMLKQGKLLAVPEGALIDTGYQKVVYRETVPGTYEGVMVKLGPRMTTPEGAAFYPILAGLSAGDRVVTAGSFLVDAETRLNPAAGSIYFGSTGGAKSASISNVRPSTPEDPRAKIEAALETLTPEDRKLARAQKYCPSLDNVLGVMGPPVKVMIEGQPVFLCCSGCERNALEHPQEMLAKVAEFKKKVAAGDKIEVSSPLPQAVETPETATAVKSSAPSESKEAAIQATLAKLAPVDRESARLQRTCPITGNRLGVMGPPVKIAIDDITVWLCCSACKGEALENPKTTLAKVAELKSANPKDKSPSP